MRKRQTTRTDSGRRWTLSAAGVIALLAALTATLSTWASFTKGFYSPP
jgi:hypothetical protein